MSTTAQSTALDPGTLGFDASTTLTEAAAEALRKAGFRFAIRYLSRASSPPPEDLTADELGIILDAGLGLMAVQHVAKPGWTPSDALGVGNGKNAASHASAVGLPAGTSVWLDLEGLTGNPPADDVVAYCNAWFGEVERAGYTSGVYVGADCGLTGDELYLRLKTQRYWRSGSRVPDITHRGYCMVQHIMSGDDIGGIGIDRDVTLVDAFGGKPMAAQRAAGVALAAPVAAAPVFDGLAVEGDARSDDAVLRSLAADQDLSDAMEALLGFRDRRGAPVSARYWAIANFNLRSTVPRFFLFDAKAGHVEAYLCAHGKGSEGPTDDGFASVFSNGKGSNCTSLGVYACAEPYTGGHGYSLRLDGLEPTNSNARDRAIVIHGADYVSPEFIKQTGRLGRSDGCFALENRYVTDVVTHLAGGSLLLAWYSQGSSDRVAEVDEIPAVWSELELPSAVARTSLPGTAAGLAQRILKSDRIILARVHPLSPADNANAYQNIADTAAGGPASRSPLPKAPGGTVSLDVHMLGGALSLAETYTVSVSEICGGVHDPNSRHYAGCAIDFTAINGQHVTATNPYVASFKQKCRDLGATEVLGPGDPGHSTHVHAGWPRP